MSHTTTCVSSLESLRRSARLALLVLVIFLLRVGMVAACAPGDIAEATAGTVQAAHAMESEQLPPGDAGDEHVGGHCLHCSCHHAAALAVPLQTDVVHQMQDLLVRTTLVRSGVALGRELRPPIR